MNKSIWLIVILAVSLICSTGAYCEGFNANIDANGGSNAEERKIVKVDIGCFNNYECGPESYCAKKRGHCQKSGKCKERLEVCTEIYEPVCGCDNRTYSNECKAASNGVNVESDGPCTSSEFKLNKEFTINVEKTKNNSMDNIGIKFVQVLGDSRCPIDSECILQGNAEAVFTFFREEVDNDVLQNEEDTSRSFILNTGVEPIAVSVFGYTIELVDLAPPASTKNQPKPKEYVASVVVTKKEDTICDNDLECGKDSYCKKQVGDCYGTGTCQQLPNPGFSACIQIWDPVCGCDGETYGNSCEAESAGVNIAKMGECQNGRFGDGTE